MFSPSPTSTFLVCLLLLSVLAFQSTASSPSLRSTAAAVRALRTLKAMHGEGLISDQEYLYRKATVLDQVTGSVSSVPSPNTTYDANVQFLLNIFTMGLPRSYNDILPNGHDFWKTAAYLNVGAFAPSGDCSLVLLWPELTISRGVRHFRQPNSHSGENTNKIWSQLVRRRYLGNCACLGWLGTSC